MKVLISDNLGEAGIKTFQEEPGFEVDVKTGLSPDELKKIIVDYDPLPYWRDISIDSIALFGAEDTNVPSAESAKLLMSQNNPRIQVKVYSGSGHALESPVGQGNSIIRQDALEDISTFISDVNVK